MCCGTVDNENYYSNGKRRFDNPAMTCFRCTLGVFNLLVFLTGAGLIAISFVLFDFKLQSQLFKDILGPAVKLPYPFCIFGGLIIFVSIIGMFASDWFVCCCPRSACLVSCSNSGCTLSFYIFLVFLLVIILAAVGGMTFAVSGNEDNVADLAQMRWNSLNSTSQKAFAHLYRCCGYNNTRDEFAKSCQKSFGFKRSCQPFYHNQTALLIKEVAGIFLGSAVVDMLTVVVGMIVLLDVGRVVVASADKVF